MAAEQSVSGPFISTSISDAILALSAFHAALRLWPNNISGFLSFCLIGTAASCGVYRFALKSPSDQVIACHKYLSWLASVLGMPFMAAAYYRQEYISIFANGHVASGIAMVIARNYLTEDIRMTTTDLVSGGAVVSTLFLSIYYFNPFAIIGAAIYAVSGLVIGTSGELWGIPRVDLFHYGLVVGNIAFMCGLTRQIQPVYYKSATTGH